MKKRELKVLILILILCAFGMDSWAVRYYSISNGDYSDNSIWSLVSNTGPSCNCPPGQWNNTDSVFINHDLTGGPSTLSVYTRILANGSWTRNALNLQNILELVGSAELVLSGNLSNNSSAAAFITSTASITTIAGNYTLSGGSFTHNGTLTFIGNGRSFTNNNSSVVTVINGSIIFTGNGASFVNNGGSLTINGGITFQGNNTTVTANSPITINGSLNATNNNTSITINGSGTLNVNGSINVSGGGQNSITNNGNLNVNGSINVTGGNNTTFTNNGSGSITGSGTINLPTGSNVNQFGTVNGSTTSQGGIINTGSTNLGNNSNINPNKTWNGSLTSDWNTAGNWTPNGVPLSTDNISIPSSLSRYPVFSGDTLKISTLNIQGGSVTISGAYVEILGRVWGSSGFITNNNTILNFTGNRTIKDTIRFNSGKQTIGSLYISRIGNIFLNDTVQITGICSVQDTLESNNKLVLQATSSTVYGQISNDPGVITGTITAEKVFINTNDGYRQISLPFTGTLANFNGILLKDASHNDTAQQNIYYWDATIATGSTAKGWTVPSSSSTQARAYTIFGGSSTGGLHTINSKMTFKGTYSTANKSFSVYDTYDPFNTSSNSARGWNLIPNPWPSNLNVTHLFNNNFSGINYKAIHVWSPALGQYVAICSTGVSITDYNTSDTANSATKIAPFQAFWVKVNADGSFNVNNSNRSTSNSGLQVFMKKSPNYVRLNLFDQDSAFDQIVLYPTDQGKIDLINEGEDAYKLYSMDWAVPTFAIENGADILSIKAFNSEDELIYARIRIESFKTNNTHNIYA